MAGAKSIAMTRLLPRDRMRKRHGDGAGSRRDIQGLRADARIDAGDEGVRAERDDAQRGIVIARYHRVEHVRRRSCLVDVCLSRRTAAPGHGIICCPTRSPAHPMPQRRTLADRLHDIAPFHVMEVLARARALEREGRNIVHLEIGEPDFPTPPTVVEAGIRALRDGHTHYTPALGLHELRAAIACRYQEVDANCVAVTPGASGALQLALGVLLDAGDEVLIADPGYPCNRHFVRLGGGVARLVPVGPDTGYQLTAQHVAEHWSERAKAVLLASPSNPTGSVIPDYELRAIIDATHARGGEVIVDEIYHGLTYGIRPQSALAYTRDAFVVNSFSKYYGMTGWRLGWLVAPARFMSAIERLAQNLFIAANTPAQYAALAALADDTQPELERRRAVFESRRDYLLPALRSLGFSIQVTPQGAFYLYADCSAFTDDSAAFARAVLEQAGVAITPGIDFGKNRARQHVRFSYANTLEHLEDAVARLARFVEN